MKYLITGASGPFGSGVARGLIAHGIAPRDLILVSRDPSKLREFTALGAAARQGDFDDYASLVQAFAGADKMLMISTNRVGQREPQHRNAVEAAKAAGLRHVAYTSFVGKPGTVSFAVKDHRFTERLLEQSGLDWTSLRNSQYADSMRDGGGPVAIRRGEWLSSSLGGRIAMVAREDCIRAAVAVMAGEGHEGRIYSITGPDLISYVELAQMFAELSGRPIAYREVTDDDMYAYFDGLGIPRQARDDYAVGGIEWCSDDMVSFEATIRDGDFAVLSDDVETLTGQKPVPVREFLARARAALRAIGSES